MQEVVTQVETTQENVQVPAQETVVEGVSLSKEELLAQLEERLKSGKFPVRGLSAETLRWLNGFLVEKAKYTNAQEAYWLLIVGMNVMTLVNGLDVNAKKEDQRKAQVFELTAFAIKAINYFLSKVEGTGIKAAEKYISYAQPINNAIIDIQKVEEQIEKLKKELNPEVEPAQA